MRGGKEHAWQLQPAISDEWPRASTSIPVASTSGPSTIPPGTDIRGETVTQPSTTQPSDLDGQSGFTGRSGSESDSEIYRDVLIDCNALVEVYRKGEISKASVYVEIQSKPARALGDDRERNDAAFGSFIMIIESHDSEIEAATKKGREIDQLQHSPSPPILISDSLQSDREPNAKWIKIDESAYAWIANRESKHTILWDTLTKTLKLIETYTVNPKATKRFLVNEPDCPEFPDLEWKKIISGRAVNLDTVLSGQLSTTHDDPKIEKFGGLEIMFGAIEPTKVVKNRGDWSITWNRMVRATLFAFPHQVQELASYGEYVINLFSVTHPSVHSRVIAFDKAIRKRVGCIRNLELSDFKKFSNLKIAQMDSIGVSVVSGSSKDESGKKGKRGKNWKRDKPCNK